MTARPALFLVMSLACGAASAADIRLNVDLHHERYRIEGASPHEVQASIRSNGPLAPWGERVAGNTTGDITWQLRLMPGVEGCTLVGGQVTLESTITLPEWADADRATPQLRRQWPKFIDALERHEDEHLTLMRDTVDRVRGALAAGRAAADCDALDAALDAAARQQVRLGAALNREFDLRTRHGQDEGVRLGP